MDQAIKTVSIDELVQLHPKYLQNVRSGLQKILAARLNTYKEDLKGVPVKVRCAKIQKKTALCFEDQPAIQLSLNTTYEVFQPQAGLVLSGEVAQVSAGHLGLLVNGKFSVSISRSQLPDTFEYDASMDRYIVDETTDECVGIGSIVSFQILQVDTSSHGAISIKAAYSTATKYVAFLGACCCFHRFSRSDELSNASSPVPPPPPPKVHNLDCLAPESTDFAC